MSHKSKLERIEKILSDELLWASDPNTVRGAVLKVLSENSREEFVRGNYQLKEGGIFNVGAHAFVKGATVYAGSGKSPMSRKQVIEILSA